MMAGSHIATGVLTWGIVAYNAELAFTPITVGAAVLGALAPDIDHPQSFLGARLYPVAMTINQAVGHRQVTHSGVMLGVLIVAAVYLTGAKGVSMPSAWALAGIVGYAAHMLTDAMTRSGIPLFWPLRMPFLLPPGIRTGTGGETLTVIALFASAAAVHFEAITAAIERHAATLFPLLG